MRAASMVKVRARSWWRRKRAADRAFQEYMSAALQRMRWERERSGRRIVLSVKRWIAQGELEKRRRREQEELGRRRAGSVLFQRLRASGDRRLRIKCNAAHSLLLASLLRLAVTWRRTRAMEAATTLQVSRGGGRRRGGGGEED
eukprot:547115-Hanusia_phi.AAC.1